jgi:hypothetical protein
LAITASQAPDDRIEGGEVHRRERVPPLSGKVPLNTEKISPLPSYESNQFRRILEKRAVPAIHLESTALGYMRSAFHLYPVAVQVCYAEVLVMNTHNGSCFRCFGGDVPYHLLGCPVGWNGKGNDLLEPEMSEAMVTRCTGGLQ